MVHTQPQPGVDGFYKGPDHWKLISAEHCYGFLTPVEKIQPGPTSWESHTNPERLWYHRDGSVGPVGRNGKSGTDQLLEFTSMIYYRFHLLCRIDVGIIWDDWVPSEARYRFIVNEVQEGMYGLMMIGKDSRGAIPKGNVEATPYVKLRAASPLPPPTLEDVYFQPPVPGTSPPGRRVQLLLHNATRFHTSSSSTYTLGTLLDLTGTPSRVTSLNPSHF
ncbi:uncharacterized protein C8R40DRAFT_1175069 [Lentinula edodes]|uniref:uncharacterized protein n=1 Tax=Lentinula edodes TaxID=5353 RepID=UPI001E8DE85C|nr:uncharacterized protein C8R40DRAFT_1175069 [Lentinula edodes]KAH7870855.1 hypothetical protein C8R40DRAFT_1175069 [Lentinula edodes]